MYDVSQIKTRQDFRNFIEWLAEDFKTNPSGWENDNLQSFLDALVVYTNDVKGYYTGIGMENEVEPASWRLADIICGARIYE